MDIIVTIKAVPDPDTPLVRLHVDETGRRVVFPPDVSFVMNGYDANALEAALRLKDQHGGTVTAISLGGGEARDVLKRALAMGADAAIQIDDPLLRDGDGFVTALALAKAIERVGRYDLVLGGRQASDTDAGQVVLGIAELLGLPGVTPVQQVALQEAGTLRVERLVDDGHQVLLVDLPAVLAVSSEIGEPRYPLPRGIVTASRAQIPTWGASDLGLDPTHLRPRVELRRVAVERRERRCEFVEADSPEEAGERLALRLREDGLI